MLEAVLTPIRLRVASLAAAISLTLLSAPRAGATYATGQSAVLPLGQQNFSFNGVNGSPGVAAAGMSSPSGVWSNGTLLIVADTLNNRVLIYNTLPAANGTSADIIVGQPDAASSGANQGLAAPADNTLSGPTGVFYDGTNLFISDTGNHRVLIYNALPVDNNTSADFVVGQADMISGLANRGAAASSSTLSSPSGVYSDGVSLYIADKGNNRVLLYNAIPAVNGALADVVVGQVSATVVTANQGGAPNGKTLSGPAGVYAAGTKLFVADQNNNRVLIYNPIPTLNNTSAGVTVGQVLLTSSTANQGGTVKANTLSAPAAVYSNGVKMIISDQNNNRVLVYNSVPVLNNSTASVVVGQTAMTAGAANRGLASPAADGLFQPVSALSDAAGTNIFVVDRSNNRVLLYNPFPAANGTSAAIVLGQSNMTTGTANQAASTPAANTMFRPASVHASGAKLFVADRFNSRVLIYNSTPMAANPSADVVVGQVLMSSGSSNRGGAAAANTLSFPADVYSDGIKMLVSDQSNSRVLIYNAIPAANGAAANFVLGQTALTLRNPNQGLAAPTANTLSFPAGVHFDGTNLFVADRNNNRVLIYPGGIPAGNNQAATVEVGQAGMVTGASNRGGAAAANTLSFPTDVFSTGTKLFVADQNNNRVLIWNTIPVANGTAADVVIGQPNMTSVLANQGPAGTLPAANTLSRPAAVFSDGVSLYIADQGNNRVLVYNTIPTANNAAADVVLGQTALTAGAANIGASATANTLSSPNGVFASTTTGRLYVADANNNRVVLNLPAISTPIGPAGGPLTLTTPIEPPLASLQAPPGAFSQTPSVILGAVVGFPSAPSPAGAIKATGVGVQVVTIPVSQPQKNVSLAVTYLPADVAGLDRSRLVLARYEPAQDLWVPLPSTSDTANNRVIGQTDHFSLFQIMQVDPTGNSVTNVKAFPNPLMIGQGQTTMTFSKLPPNARLRVYTATGALIKDIAVDGTGIARWDATNQAGLGVASGVYFVFAQGGGEQRTVKVAVQR